MRSIAEDLEERLAAIPQRKQGVQARYEAELRVIEEDERVLKDMLALERRLSEHGRPSINGRGSDGLLFGAGNESEADILRLLSDGSDWDHADMKGRLPEVKARLKADDTSFGRILHGMLMSMKLRRLVEHVGVGKWRIGPEAEALRPSP